MTVSQEQKTENPRLLKRKEVETKTSMAASTIYAEIAKGKFPKPVQLSPRRVAWLESEIDKWIAERIANRKSNLRVMES